MATIISLRNQIALLLLAVSLTAVSYFYLDNGIALLVYRLLSASELLSKAASDIPDLLLHIVVAITVMSWAGYFFLRHRGVCNRHTRFFQVCGTVVPIAFVTKAIFQYVFGRSDPQAWVLDHELPRFYWFRSGDRKSVV